MPELGDRERVCERCHGDGEITYNPAYPDPQGEQTACCPGCHGEGALPLCQCHDGKPPEYEPECYGDEEARRYGHRCKRLAGDRELEERIRERFPYGAQMFNVGTPGEVVIPCGKDYEPVFAERRLSLPDLLSRAKFDPAFRERLGL